MQMTVALEVQCPASGLAETYTNFAQVATSTVPDDVNDPNSYYICDSDGTNVFCGYDTWDVTPETLFGNFGTNNTTSASLDVPACPDLEVSLDSTLTPDTD